MATDAEKISVEDHELNYLLEKWGKSQSKDNREKLAAIVHKFNQLSEYRKSNREDFYTYIDKSSTLLDSLS